MKTLLLVDASSYLYRAFHALPDLRNQQGEPTGAIYGVLNMLRRLHRDTPSDYSACVFDAKGRTFREDLYAQYKANRPPMPDDLRAQTEGLHECIRASGWPVIAVTGVEADDVIATLAGIASRAGVRTIISSGDKDLTQLVSPQVTMVNTLSGEVFDEAGVMGKFGVRPVQIVDYLTLVGDASDNVPGVAKVGPKTAVRWLTDYGSIDILLARSSEIGGVVGENLRKALDWLPTARELLTVRTDVELPVALEQLRPVAPDVTALAALYRRFEFRGWLRELENPAPVPAGVPEDSSAMHVIAHPPAEHYYETLLTEEALVAWIRRAQSAELTCVDTETTSLDPLAARLVGISLSVTPGSAAYLPLTHDYPGAPPQLGLTRALELLQPWLEDRERPKLAQNAKYDSHVFANHGIRLAGVAHDTLLQSYVLESHRPHDMDSLALRHLGRKTISYEAVAGKGAHQIGFSQVNLEVATEYSGEDADVTLQLHAALFPQVQAEPALLKVYAEIEMPLTPVLLRMERTGILLDSGKLARQSAELGAQLMALEQRAQQLAGGPFNLNSPKQIQEILYVRHQLPVLKKTPGGQPSTDEAVLEQLALDYPLAKVLLDYRGLSKLKSTYTDKLPRMVNPSTGRVHTNFAQAVAVTGRLSSTDPNLQNIPVRTAEGRRIREAFIAAPGCQLVSADYSQIELRIMAHLSRDPGLLQAFTRGEDVHRHTASEVFTTPLAEVSGEQRRYAKAINFGLIYGMSAFGLAGQLGIERSAAQQYMERYFARYPGVRVYMEETRAFARDRGYVETVLGRRLFLADIRAASGPRRQGAERAAINAPMQGTAADLIKLAMVKVHHWLQDAGMASRMLLQVHDELVLEVPEAELDDVRATLPRLMSGVAELAVPLVVDVGSGPNWEQAH